MISEEDNDFLYFEFEDFLKKEEEENVDRREICKFFLKGTCNKGQNCTFRHVNPQKSVVCKHWLRGLCKKNEQCEFLHEYNPEKMPECWFFQKYGVCSNPECIFLHIKEDDKQQECPWYARGFCFHGQNCKFKHTQKVACPDYLAGFCIKGPNCKYAHPPFELPEIDERMKKKTTKRRHAAFSGKSQGSQQISTYDGPSNDFPIENIVQKRSYSHNGNHGNHGNNNGNNNGNKSRRPLSEVLCFKCRQRGHYANVCPLRGKMKSNYTAIPTEFNPMVKRNGQVQEMGGGPPGVNSIQTFNAGPIPIGVPNFNQNDFYHHQNRNKSRGYHNLQM